MCRAAFLTQIWPLVVACEFYWQKQRRQCKVTVLAAIIVDGTLNVAWRKNRRSRTWYTSERRTVQHCACMYVNSFSIVTSSHIRYYSIFCSVRMIKHMISKSVYQEAPDSYLIIEIRALPVTVWYPCSSLTLRKLASNMILKKLGANRWIPLIVFCWGIITTMTGLIQNFGDLVAVRMVLGLCEGGLLPGIVSELDKYLYQCQLICSHRFCISAPYINVTNSNCGEHSPSPLSFH